MSKAHVPGIGHFIANSLLFFANQYVSIIIARSDTKSYFMAIRPCTFGVCSGVKGKKCTVGVSPE